ncbi:CobW family GTP-binding protein [Ruminiclostridium cellobioparum]|uniref:CobW family GTP-binding protein n=1 Tax=Ruminiclostridium cellobioparum TaxID=29355 RepID=UPI0004879D38|nr:GTP-binding protein [Ruminiclostridium cellobioparum]
MKTKVDIISGFLGSGKTTLIKKLMAEKLHDEKLVIIENEFGEIGIDGSILKESGIEVKEINSGCICCTLVGDFGKSIEEVLHKYKPDRIIIEPSGVGKLSDILKACDSLSSKDLLTINMVITVVDILKYKMYILNFGEFYENQIKHAKTIILSRSQKAEADKLVKFTGEIGKLNSKANIITTPWEELNAGQIISAAEQNGSAALEQQIKKVVLKRHVHPEGCKCGCKGTQHTHHNADEFFEVWGAETPKTYDAATLRKILENLGSTGRYGNILRAKGIIQSDRSNWVQFDYVPGEFEIKDSGADYTGRLCVIGRELNRKELDSLFNINT